MIRIQTPRRRAGSWPATLYRDVHWQTIHTCMLTIQSSVQHIAPKYDQRAKIPRHLMKPLDMKGEGGRMHMFREEKKTLQMLWNIQGEKIRFLFQDSLSWNVKTPGIKKRLQKNSERKYRSVERIRDENYTRPLSSNTGSWRIMESQIQNSEWELF